MLKRIQKLVRDSTPRPSVCPSLGRKGQVRESFSRVCGRFTYGALGDAVIRVE
ncbi:MAG: hypothetical protein HUU45_10385 [Leptospiraceae bacterium]|nr:hypothetical protein [Leptospiraceae bacterium]